jgi:hypothetical protein
VTVYVPLQLHAATPSNQDQVTVCLLQLYVYQCSTRVQSLLRTEKASRLKRVHSDQYNQCCRQCEEGCEDEGARRV